MLFSHRKIITSDNISLVEVKTEVIFNKNSIITGFIDYYHKSCIIDISKVYILIGLYYLYCMFNQNRYAYIVMGFHCTSHLDIF